MRRVRVCVAVVLAAGWGLACQAAAADGGPAALRVRAGMQTFPFVEAQGEDRLAADMASDIAGRSGLDMEPGLEDGTPANPDAPSRPVVQPMPEPISDLPSGPFVPEDAVPPPVEQAAAG